MPKSSPSSSSSSSPLRGGGKTNFIRLVDVPQDQINKVLSELDDYIRIQKAQQKDQKQKQKQKKQNDDDNDDNGGDNNNNNNVDDGDNNAGNNSSGGNGHEVSTTAATTTTTQSSSSSSSLPPNLTLDYYFGRGATCNVLRNNSVCLHLVMKKFSDIYNNLVLSDRGTFAEKYVYDVITSRGGTFYTIPPQAGFNNNNNNNNTKVINVNSHVHNNNNTNNSNNTIIINKSNPNSDIMMIQKMKIDPTLDGIATICSKESAIPKLTQTMRDIRKYQRQQQFQQQQSEQQQQQQSPKKQKQQQLELQQQQQQQQQQSQEQLDQLQKQLEQASQRIRSLSPKQQQKKKPTTTTIKLTPADVVAAVTASARNLETTTMNTKQRTTNNTTTVTRRIKQPRRASAARAMDVWKGHDTFKYQNDDDEHGGGGGKRRRRKSNNSSSSINSSSSGSSNDNDDNDDDDSNGSSSSTEDEDGTDAEDNDGTDEDDDEEEGSDEDDSNEEEDQSIENNNDPTTTTTATGRRRGRPSSSSSSSQGLSTVKNSSSNSSSSNSTVSGRVPKFIIPFGRGGLNNKHPGHKLFHSYLHGRRTLYLESNRRLFAKNVVKSLEDLGAVFTDGIDGDPLPHYDAVSKTMQSLRDGCSFCKATKKDKCRYLDKTMKICGVGFEPTKAAIAEAQRASVGAKAISKVIQTTIKQQKSKPPSSANGEKGNKGRIVKICSVGRPRNNATSKHHQYRRKPLLEHVIYRTDLISKLAAATNNNNKTTVDKSSYTFTLFGNNHDVIANRNSNNNNNNRNPVFHHISSNERRSNHHHHQYRTTTPSSRHGPSVKRRPVYPFVAQHDDYNNARRSRRFGSSSASQRPFQRSQSVTDYQRHGPQASPLDRRQSSSSSFSSPPPVPPPTTVHTTSRKIPFSEPYVPQHNLMANARLTQEYYDLRRHYREQQQGELAEEKKQEDNDDDNHDDGNESMASSSSSSSSVQSSSELESDSSDSDDDDDDDNMKYFTSPGNEGMGGRRRRSPRLATKGGLDLVVSPSRSALKAAGVSPPKMDTATTTTTTTSPISSPLAARRLSSEQLKLTEIYDHFGRKEQEQTSRRVSSPLTDYSQGPFDEKYILICPMKDVMNHPQPRGRRYPGNAKLTKLVELMLPMFGQQSKERKRQIAQSIVKELHREGSRFFAPSHLQKLFRRRYALPKSQKDGTTQSWFEVSDKDAADFVLWALHTLSEAKSQPSAGGIGPRPNPSVRSNLNTRRQSEYTYLRFMYAPSGRQFTTRKPVAPAPLTFRKTPVVYSRSGSRFTSKKPVAASPLLLRSQYVPLSFIQPGTTSNAWTSLRRVDENVQYEVAP